MKTWKTAVRPMGCGYDGTHRIAQGEAYLELEEGSRKRVRCSKCAARYETHVPAQPETAPAPAPEPEPELEMQTEQDPW